MLYVRYVIKFILLFPFAPAFAQCPQIDTSGVLTFAEQMPEPTINIKQYIVEHSTYPQDARVANKEGRVIVKFIVREDSSISNVTIARPVFKSLDSVAANVITNMPKWKPGMQNGKPVSVYYSLPVEFVLKDAPIVYTHVDQMPYSTVNIEEFLRKNLNYPADAKIAGIQRTVDVVYVIDEYGYVCGAKVERPIFPSLDSEALRLTRILPPFIPGHKDGKAVKVCYKLSVIFDIRDDSIQKMLDPVYENVDEMPTPTFNIQKYINMNLMYPVKDVIAKTNGLVIVGFTVNEDGSISDIKKITSTGTLAMTSEAMRVALEMPHWNPGKINGKPVKVYSILPIEFNIKEAAKNHHHYKSMRQTLNLIGK